MDFEPNLSSENSNEILKENTRSRGVLGFEYKAQAQIIRKKHGDLEVIRHRLGLSRRKIAQILLVDPSAWTRWTKTGEDAPPHIYRALEWFLLLQDKYPGMDSAFWLEAVARPSANRADTNSLKEGISEMNQKIGQFQTKLRWLQAAVSLLVLILLAGLVLSQTSCTTHSKKITAVEDITKQEVALPNSPMKEIAQRFAPIFVHELGPVPKADVFTRVDFDNDWIGDNNWSSMDKFSLDPAVYYEVFSTKTHYFIMYGLYHPRDYSKYCFPIICHENDMEGALVVVDRKSMEWVYTESVAHNLIYSQKNKDAQSRPTLVVEWGGHGIYPSEGYVFKVENKFYRPPAYGLEPIAQLWNLQFKEKKLFDNEFDYKGSRFHIFNIPKAFLGREWTRDSANPPWAWVDLKQGTRGDLFFDPAGYVASKHKELKFDLEYERHPYLVHLKDSRAPATVVQ